MTPGAQRRMTRGELAAAVVGSYGRDYSESDDGYSDMEAESRRGWTAVSAWGEDGWDLGDWPYVSILVRQHDSSKCDPICTLAARGSDFCPAWELLSLCEGDRTHYAFDTRRQMVSAIDAVRAAKLANRAAAEEIARLDALRSEARQRLSESSDRMTLACNALLEFAVGDAS